MEALYPLLIEMLNGLWWPFCRIMAMLTMSPVIGEATVPVRVKILLALVLSVIVMPMATPVASIDPMSLQGIIATFEQVLIGGLMGLAFHLSMAAILVLGYMLSSQIGLAMAVMNDPLNGTSSDVVSSLLSVLSILAFFSMDGHLVLTGILGASFSAWPVGGGWSHIAIETVAYNVAWVFSAAMLLAIPVVFATLVVQVGFGFLTRVAPTLNLFALGFSVITLFGLFMLAQMVRFIPEHYVRLTGQVLQMLEGLMRGGLHGG